MQVYCILSDERVYNSKSPVIFTTVLKWLGIDGVYVPFKVAPDRIGQAMQSLRVLNIAGANVTVPYKETVIPYLDIMSEGANIIGAVNTIVRNGDELKGYNTNAIGIMDALSNAGFDTDGKSALVCGTGGAARAAVFILNWLRTDKIIVAGRDLTKAKRIVNDFSGEVRLLNTLPEEPLPVDIVINATSVSSPIESKELAEVATQLKLPECQLVFDLNYDRSPNFWQAMAAERDIPFMDGQSALAYQARRTLALWTRMQAPPEEFLKALNQKG